MEIVGHERIIKFLQKSAAHHKLSHAYLFYGPQHIGKTTVATNFACYLLCSSLSSPTFRASAQKWGMTGGDDGMTTGG
ncbi:hypothetical protein MYX07_03730, partial [Patescibacteria group bacterium AH-259-L07]|nr:hypothetical protein [Patescibacteria group bacterium AH-259-L07]